MPDEIKNIIEREELKASVKAIHIQIGANAEIQNMILTNIENVVKDTLEQTKETNGRVNKLEDLTEVIRILKKRKWLIAIILFGLMKIYEVIDIKKLIDILINYIL